MLNDGNACSLFQRESKWSTETWPSRFSGRHCPIFLRLKQPASHPGSANDRIVKYNTLYIYIYYTIIYTRIFIYIYTYIVLYYIFMLYQLSLCIVTTALCVACKGRAGVWKLDLQHSASKVIATSISRPDFSSVSHLISWKKLSIVLHLCASLGLTRGYGTNMRLLLRIFALEGTADEGRFRYPAETQFFWWRKAFCMRQINCPHVVLATARP
jgi:hypothetical protein